MWRVILIFCVFSQAKLEMKKFQHQVYIDKKSRPYQEPITIGFTYKASGGPQGITKIYNTHNKPIEKVTENIFRVDLNKNNLTTKKDQMDYQKNWQTTNEQVYLSPKQNYENVKAKTKSFQSKEKDALEAMNIQPSDDIMNSKQTPNNTIEMFTSYAADKDFIIDNEDVRTDSKNTYNGWPYSYYNPYDYGIQNLNSVNEKAKDKRFLGVFTTVKPVRKNVVDSAIDNPVYGDQPFISFVLNDYFEKHSEEDPILFKDSSWGEDFDNKVSTTQENENNDRLSRRLHHSTHPDEKQNRDVSLGRIEKADEESVTYKVDNSIKEFIKHRKGDGKKAHPELNNSYQRQREKAFKDFADSFANKFGSEESNKNSTFVLKTNQDQGQKRKGFKRVYHKDEYQEDSEFYDNINKNAKSDENGGSKYNTSGSQSVLHSHLVGSTGKEANSSSNSGNKDSKIFHNKNQVTEKNNERVNEINHYRNIAKNAAMSNNLDYVDSFTE